jgi:hypothetical protein
MHEDLSDLKSMATKAGRLHTHHRDVISVNAITAAAQELHLEKNNGSVVVLWGQPSKRGGGLTCSVAKEPPMLQRQQEQASGQRCQKLDNAMVASQYWSI